MMHASPESDFTSSIAPSSTASNYSSHVASPLYTVQSPPSRGSKIESDSSGTESPSFQRQSRGSTSPSSHVVFHPCTVQSPSSRDSKIESDSSGTESPSFPRQSRGSASPSSPASRTSRVSRKWNKQQYLEVVKEEGEEEDEEGDGRDRFRDYFKVLVLGMIFAGFCLIIWCASRPNKARVSIKSLKVYSLYYGEGSDRTGVPTKLITVNCSANLVISNPATSSGIHVSSQPVNLIYSEITVANGQLKKYYQPRNSTRIMSVSLVGRSVPLYGTGFSIAASDQSGGIPLKLEIPIQLTSHPLGNLVKKKHTRHISCSLIISSKYTKEITFKHNSCKYV